MAKKLFKSVILGAPAAGKGTISAKIVRTFNLKHISSGDKLRQHIQDQTTIGLKAKQYINQGKLVPDRVVIKFICDEIDTVGPVWILDGFPRTVAQAKALWKLHKLNLALHLIVPARLIIHRIKGRWVHLPSGRVYNDIFNRPKIRGIDDVTGEPLVQRDDDKPKVMKKRLEQYETQSKPVIEFYRRKGILKEFDGSYTYDVWPKIADCLATHIPAPVT